MKPRRPNNPNWKKDHDEDYLKRVCPVCKSYMQLHPNYPQTKYHKCPTCAYCKPIKRLAK